MERYFGIHVLRYLPRGTDFFHDVRIHLGNLDIRRVFDVGANIGQSARRYHEEFPAATIHCFEPVPATYSGLCDRVRGCSRIHPHEIAMGSVRGLGRVDHGGHPEANRVVRLVPPVQIGDQSGAAAPNILIDTLDDFCTRHGIAQIDFLKVDTEGSDLDVLLGAREMLAAHRIFLIQVEVGMHAENGLHVPFEKMKHFLESLDYFLFGIYDQVSEAKRDDERLRRTNTVFASKNVLATYAEVPPSPLS